MYICMHVTGTAPWSLLPITHLNDSYMYMCILVLAKSVGVSGHVLSCLLCGLVIKLHVRVCVAICQKLRAFCKF